jgi:hypothetical protein
MAKHTEGPWEWHTDDTLVGADAVVIDGIPFIDNEADFRLIAAAPDLLEACRGIETVYAELSAALPDTVANGAFDSVTAAVKAARAAVAKAEGR